MFTANSMNCLCEALGLALPGNGTIVATSHDRRKLWKAAAKRVVEMAKENGPLPRDIADTDAFHNALTLDMAMGGSSNTILHTLAVAREAGIKLDLAKIDKISKSTPHICKVSPSCNYHIEDVHRVGGIMAIIKEVIKQKGVFFNPRQDDRFRKDHRRTCRRRGRCRRHRDPYDRQSLQQIRRAFHSVRQSCGKRLCRQDRRRFSEDAQTQRSRSSL